MTAAPPPSPDRTRPRVARRLAFLLAWALPALALAPASLLVVVAETRAGRLCGGVAASLLVALGAGFGAWKGPGRPWAWGCGAILGLGAASGLAAALARGAAPDRPEGRWGLQSRFRGGSRLPNLAPARLVPERDQMALALGLTRLAPWSARARAIRETTLGLYRSIDADPGARGLGAVTDLGLREVLGLPFLRLEHAFAYVPEPRADERLGLVVFLHGNGGNFQVLPWAWRPFADRERFAILCPTFGCGFWGEGGVEAIDRALDDALARWPIDPARVYLGGISDGGVGVTRSARAHPGRYRGLIYASPTMKLDELASPDFARGWRGRPILVLQGGRDWNVRRDTVDPAVDLLRRQGADVSYHVDGGEDHFLFFSKRLELFGVIGEWMGARPGVPDAPPHPHEPAGHAR